MHTGKRTTNTTHHTLITKFEPKIQTRSFLRCLCDLIHVRFNDETHYHLIVLLISMSYIYIGTTVTYHGLIRLLQLLVSAFVGKISGTLNKSFTSALPAQQQRYGILAICSNEFCRFTTRESLIFLSSRDGNLLVHMA